MSKSAESEFSRVNLLDDADTIQKKLKRAKTDTFQGLESDNPERPEARNLITMYQLMTGHSKVGFCILSPTPSIAALCLPLSSSVTADMIAALAIRETTWLFLQLKYMVKLVRITSISR